ncbi:MAG TPA: hypothetical protein VGG36_01530 [Rhizomicrobium sp.]
MTNARATRKPDDWVRLTFFAGIGIVLTIVVLIVLRRLFPALHYPLTLIWPYGVSVVGCGVVGFALRAWQKGAPASANLTASLICFVVPAVALYAMIAVACRSIALQCLGAS